jgi:hypothetical protein
MADLEGASAELPPAEGPFLELASIDQRLWPLPLKMAFDPLIRDHLDNELPDEIPFDPSKREPYSLLAEGLRQKAITKRLGYEPDFMSLRWRMGAATNAVAVYMMLYGGAIPLETVSLPPVEEGKLLRLTTSSWENLCLGAIGLNRIQAAKALGYADEGRGAAAIQVDWSRTYARLGVSGMAASVVRVFQSGLWTVSPLAPPPASERPAWPEIEIFRR